MKWVFAALTAMLVLAPFAAGAATREDVIQGASRCADIEDNRIWLDCYYGAAQPMREQLGLPPAPASQVNRVPPAPANSRASTVRTSQVPTKRGLLGRIFSGGAVKVQMKSYSFDDDGLFTVALSNGQSWEQLSYDDVNYAHWKGPASNYNVTVTENSFGHADLVVDGTLYKVKLTH